MEHAKMTTGAKDRRHTLSSMKLVLVGYLGKWRHNHLERRKEEPKKSPLVVTLIRPRYVAARMATEREHQKRSVSPTRNFV